ncbi:FtsX-like permease family protein [Ferrimonas marina]|uniref:Putative ABC transport system permease protein n=1 Tax=Ferrimonas marina TaxID=299255 RepID=A0A1M5YE17_9GAMM|nr:FtsX-like permease family protein [Ferrimonas marina]SHI10226.1 putative ABC transport system permease protein [Ferrimonas marina]
MVKGTMARDFLALSLGDLRRHRWLYLWLALGLVLAGALLSGVEALNRAAKASFTTAEQGLDTHYPWRLHSLLAGQRIHRDLFLELRRAGIQARPVSQRMIRLEDGQVVRVRGVELPPGYLSGQRGWQTIVDQRQAERLGWLDEQRLTSEQGVQLPPLTLRADVGPWLIMDIGQAARVTGSGPWLSYLELPPLTEAQQRWVEARLGDDLVLRPMAEAGDSNLLEAFSLNLTALSSLSFLVGLLLAFHALERLVQHRSQSLNVLHQLGFTRRQWLTALMVELALWSALAGLVGSLIGIRLARFLSPGVSDTLVALYNMQQPLSLSWNWGHALFCFAILFAALALMILWLLRPGMRRRTLTGLILALAALVMALQLAASNQNQALALVALTVLLSILLLPPVLQWGSRQVARLAPRLPVEWAWGMWDLSSASRRLVIPMIAITLALSSAIATRILVGSFEQALGQFLESRLHADIYLYADQATLERIKPELAAMPEVSKLQARSQRQGQVGETPVRIVGYNDQPQPWAFMTFSEVDANWWPALQNGRGCLINEPMAMRRNLVLGDELQLNSGNRAMSCRVMGVYFDYGNPHSEVTLPIPVMARRFGQAPPDGYSLILAPGVDLSNMLLTLQQRYELPQAGLVAQRTLREQANGLFRRTFDITDALAWLTLSVAMVSWFASLAAQQQGWVRQQAVVSALGMVRGQILRARMAQLVVQMGLVAGVSVAVGLLLGWQLIHKVNPLAFGWSMPVHLGSGDWGSGLLSACLILLLVAVGPIWWQTRRSLAWELSREEA